MAQFQNDFFLISHRAACGRFRHDKMRPNWFKSWDCVRETTELRSWVGVRQTKPIWINLNFLMSQPTSRIEILFFTLWKTRNRRQDIYFYPGTIFLRLAFKFEASLFSVNILLSVDNEYIMDVALFALYSIFLLNASILLTWNVVKTPTATCMIITISTIKLIKLCAASLQFLLTFITFGSP